MPTTASSEIDSCLKMSESASPVRPFKVIIAGGSVAGLTLANALEKSGIDFELLEKRDVAPQLGQTILVMPCTNLVHEQLNLEKPIREIAFPIGMREHYDEKGTLFCSSDELIQLHHKQKRPMYFIDRKILLDALYQGLSETSRSKLYDHEGIQSFSETEHSVSVTTDKGRIVEGSILVGADGVHSAVRQHLAKLMFGGNPKESSILAGSYLSTRYRIMTCTSHNFSADEPTKPFLKIGQMNNTYYPEHGVGAFSVVGVEGRIFWALYIANSEETAYPSPRYSQTDIERDVEKWGHLFFGTEYTVSDLWKTQIGVNMLPMEEGILPTKWHSGGRTVLIGDSVHKSTANLGMGGNLCVDDACALVNGLHVLLEKTKEPSSAELVKVFEAYEKAERPRANFVKQTSGIFCGFETGSKWYSGILKFVFPLVPSSMKMLTFSGFDGSAPVLDFLPMPAVPTVKVA